MRKASCKRVCTIEFHLNEGEKQQNQFMVKEVKKPMAVGIRGPCVVLEKVCILTQNVVIHTCIFIDIYAYIYLHI